MKNKSRYDPHGDRNSRHRQDEHRRWHSEYDPVSLSDIKPFQIIGTRERSIISALIVSVSISDGHPAWLSHVGQVMADGRTVSEATFPIHSYTPIEDFLYKYSMRNSRLTIMQLRDGIYQSDEIKRQAQRECQLYHESLEGTQYQVSGLLPMLMTSILRNSNPFLKRGTWEAIPQEKEKEVYVCSAEIDYGFSWLQRKINHDIFPSTLSLKIPSPQDIFDSPDTQFVAGTRKIIDR